jgi:UTP-glucose-1-phosphate uridylyltransferase
MHQRQSTACEINAISEQCDFSYIEQQEMLGLGHAIYTGKPLPQCNNQGFVHAI